MKMARATEKDIEVMNELGGLLEAVSDGWWPCGPDDSPSFDEFAREVLRIYRKSPGAFPRVNLGYQTLTSPHNGIINQASDVLELSPELLAKKGGE